MKFTLAIISLILTVVWTSCSGLPASSEPVHEEMNAVYYWKTVFSPDSGDMAFIRRHNIGRIYLRLFDVVKATDPMDMNTVPNATLRIDDEAYRLLTDSLDNVEFVPVVYITLDALKAEEQSGGELASNIVTRIRNMCQYNHIPNVSEIQLDCDWTASTEERFFALCDSVKRNIVRLNLPWRLSSTIRLHQLRRKAPPVDNGVLMVYNTGSFDDPDAANSILDARDVEPYLDGLAAYPLHLDVAYPTYSWQLLFRHRRFLGLLNGVNVRDTSLFEPSGHNVFVARRDIPYNVMIIRAGDIVREEMPSFADIACVRRLIEGHLHHRTHSNILYHLDSRNLSKFTNHEIDSLLSAAD